MSFTKQTLSHLPDGKEGLNYGQALPETDQTEHMDGKDVDVGPGGADWSLTTDDARGYCAPAENMS